MNQTIADLDRVHETGIASGSALISDGVGGRAQVGKSIERSPGIINHSDLITVVCLSTLISGALWAAV